MRQGTLSQPRLDELGAVALEGLLMSTFGCDLQRVTDLTVAALIGPDALIVRVPIRGSQAEGQMLLSLSPVLSARLMTIFVGQTDSAIPDTSQLIDFAGELCNMLAGRLGALLAAVGIELELGTPSGVSAADARQLEHWLTWRCGPLPIGICVQLDGLQ
jgi:CheY-specific phosphatase CheX